MALSVTRSFTEHRGQGIAERILQHLPLCTLLVGHVSGSQILHIPELRTSLSISGGDGNIDGYFVARHVGRGLFDPLARALTEKFGQRLDRTAALELILGLLVLGIGFPNLLQGQNVAADATIRLLVVRVDDRPVPAFFQPGPQVDGPVRHALIAPEYAIERESSLHID